MTVIYISSQQQQQEIYPILLLALVLFDLYRLNHVWGSATIGQNVWFIDSYCCFSNNNKAMLNCLYCFTRTSCGCLKHDNQNKRQKYTRIKTFRIEAVIGILECDSNTEAEDFKQVDLYYT
ncbi:hypothetical protein GOODEAATRI_012119 [Goodea atripinnis]|uniref:Uncharacterized protein n=1 Tax=Goodea atripinnis TaxID=208336 RepID=A0ABV0PXW3_9TELE